MNPKPPEDASDLTAADPAALALLEAGLGTVVFGSHGEVLQSTQVADALLSIQRKGGRAQACAGLQLENGKAVGSLLALGGEELPAILRVSRPEAEPHLMRVSGVPGLRAFVLQDLGDEHSADAAELDLLDVLAHDLRAGLMPLKTYTQMLLTGILGPVAEKQSEALHAVDTAVERQTERITVVLDMVKAQQNRLDLQLEPVSLLDVIKPVLAAAEREYTRRGLRMSADFESGTFLINGDLTRLQHVFRGLLGRAMRQCPQGAALGVETRAFNGKARLRLWDTGTGNTPQDLEVLFQDSSEQARARRRRKTPVDLQLATVCDILKRHDAALEVQSERSAGTTYRLYFPLLKKAASAVPGDAGPSLALLAGGGEALQTARQYLESRGWQTDVFAAGAEALKNSRKDLHRLVLAADSLEDMDALRLCGALRAERPDELRAFGVAFTLAPPGELLPAGTVQVPLNDPAAMAQALDAMIAIVETGVPRR